MRASIRDTLGLTPRSDKFDFVNLRLERACV